MTLWYWIEQKKPSKFEHHSDSKGSSKETRAPTAVRPADHSAVRPLHAGFVELHGLVDETELWLNGRTTMLLRPTGRRPGKPRGLRPWTSVPNPRYYIVAVPMFGMPFGWSAQREKLAKSSKSWPQGTEIRVKAANLRQSPVAVPDFNHGNEKQDTRVGDTRVPHGTGTDA